MVVGVERSTHFRDSDSLAAAYQQSTDRRGGPESAFQQNDWQRDQEDVSAADGHMVIMRVGRSSGEW